MVFVSTVVGGLQIEAAQRYGATGRLASLRNGLEGVMSLLAGPVGGWLAVRTFGWTALGGALVVLSFVPVVLLLDREPRGAQANRQVWTMAREHLRVIARSRAMWGATGLLFLVYLAPGFQTPMLYYQQDVLKLDPRFMGFLQLLGGAGGIIGAALYAAALPPGAAAGVADRGDHRQRADHADVSALRLADGSGRHRDGRRPGRDAGDAADLRSAGAGNAAPASRASRSR